MLHKNTTTSTKAQEKREKLIELSAKAKALRQQMIDNAKTAEEAAMWESCTINHILLKFIYNTNGDAPRYEKFETWKKEGATIKKGAKATVIWGQPRKGHNKPAEPAKADLLATEDTEGNEYEFFPLCFLFSEFDVVFPNAPKDEQEKEEPAPAPMKVSAEVIDSSAFDNL